MPAEGRWDLNRLLKGSLPLRLREVEILRQSVLTSALEWIEWLASHTGSCTLHEDIRYTLYMGLRVQHFGTYALERADLPRQVPDHDSVLQ